MSRYLTEKRQPFYRSVLKMRCLDGEMMLLITVITLLVINKVLEKLVQLKSTLKNTTSLIGEPLTWCVPPYLTFDKVSSVRRFRTVFRFCYIYYYSTLERSQNGKNCHLISRCDCSWLEGNGERPSGVIWWWCGQNKLQHITKIIMVMFFKIITPSKQRMTVTI